LKCIARKGIGKDHAKWSPVSTAVFRHWPEIVLNKRIMNTMTSESLLSVYFRLTDKCLYRKRKIGIHSKFTYTSVLLE